MKSPFSKAPLKQTHPKDIIYEHLIHNMLFPSTRYRFIGISEDIKGFTKMKMRNIASYQCHIAFCIRRNALAHELLSAAVGENHEFILRMLMQG